MPLPGSHARKDRVGPAPAPARQDHEGARVEGRGQGGGRGHFRPAIGAPDEAIERITATTICGSDLHLYHASIPAMRKGDILGHECMGIVDAVGDALSHVAVGTGWW